MSSLFCIPLFFNTGKIVINCRAIEPTWVNCKARQFHLLGLKPLGKTHSIERVQAISVDNREDPPDEVYSANHSVTIKGRQSQKTYYTFIRADKEVRLFEQFLQRAAESSDAQSFALVMDDRRFVLILWISSTGFFTVGCGLAAVLPQPDED